MFLNAENYEENFVNRLGKHYLSDRIGIDTKANFKIFIAKGVISITTKKDGYLKSASHFSGLVEDMDLLS